MQLSELRAAVRIRADVPPTDGIWTDAFVDDAINEAVVEVSQAELWPWLELAETLTYTGGLPATTDPIRAVRAVSDGTSLYGFVPSIDIDQYETVDAERGAVFAVTAGVIELRPEPVDGTEIKVRYYRDEPALVDDVDTPLSAPMGDRAVIRLACAIGFEGIDDQSSAAMHRGAAERLVDSLRNSHLKSVTGPRSPRLRPGAQY